MLVCKRKPRPENHLQKKELEVLGRIFLQDIKSITTVSGLGKTLFLVATDYHDLIDIKDTTAVR
jgi:hypothetical protein